MKKKLMFRISTTEEREIIQSDIEKQFGSSSLEALEDYQLWIKDGKIMEVYAVPFEINNILTNLKANVYCAGLPLGTISENLFQLEIEGAYLLLPFTDKILNIKTEQFLYGKPIFIENIRSFKNKFRKNDWLIIIGQNNIHYGIGKARLDSTKLKDAKPNTIIISEYKQKPMDRGWYLRRGN
ncbi:MAG: NIP7 pre-PUA domain-containing protein [Candidatus Heimdallarchaeaceae archaeon]|jgi:ribosome biogenesis protein Nip4